jgi:glucose/arabinose dehydrogenase
MRARVFVLSLVLLLVSSGVAQAGVPGQPTVVASGFSVPWAISWLPDGQSALVTQRNDFHVWRVTRSGQRTDVGVVPESQGTGGEGGLMGVAVSRTWNGTSDQAVYFMHTASDGNRVARMSFNGSALSGYTVLVRGIQKNTFHNGGRLAFGPDGFLYATAGDAQNTSNAQNTSSLNGKILRFTTTGQPAPGNPFGNLVYSYGHRNPQGLAWDSAGRLWSAELGQNTWDELNLIEPGRNYGWPVCEGTCTDARFTNPKATWSTAQASPSGLAIVGSTAFMGALRGQRLWRIELNGTSVGTISSHFQGQFGRIRAVAGIPGTNAIWLSTSNADSVGGQPSGSDRILASTITG